MRGVVVRIMITLVLLSSTSWAASASASVAADAAAKRNASREGWPDTPAGVVARQWVEAFSTGEDAMRAFLKQYVSEQSLAKRSVSQRVESYRKLRERYGKLMLASVRGESKGELKVQLMASDASTHTFVFKVETESPHKLVSVGITQKGFAGHGGHGGGGFHH